MQQISSQLMSGLSSSQEPLCEDPLQAMFHHFLSICRGFAWANFEVLWSLKSVIPHCPELEVHHTNGSGVLLCHSSHSPLMCCEVWWLPPPPQCLAAEGVYDPVRIHPTQAVGQHLSLHWKFWISASLLMITSLSPPLPRLAKAVSAPLWFLMIRLPLKDPVWRCLVPLCQMMLLVIRSPHCWHSVHSHQAMNFVLRFPKGICRILDLFC